MPQRTIKSPVGAIRLTSENGVLIGLRIKAEPEPDVPGDERLLDLTVLQLCEYFIGTRTIFDLPLAPSQSVRGAALRAAIVGIPHGGTMGYGELARIAGSGARAIGQACARNPLPIVIPCHRVLAAEGIGQYSGGDGIKTKQWLLAHEAGSLWK